MRRVIRRMGRTVAVAMLVIGINGVLTRVAPRYEALYLCLAAVAAISWLDGMVAGLVGAAAVVGAYEWLFTRSHSVVPFAWAVAIAVVGATVRRLRKGAAAQPVAAVAEESPAPVPPERELTRRPAQQAAQQPEPTDNGQLAAARADVAAVRAQLAVARAESERIGEAARERETALRTQLADTAGKAAARDDERKRAETDLAQALTAIRKLRDELARTQEETTREVDDARGAAEKLAASESRAGDLARQLTELTALREADAASFRDHERRLHEQYEQETENLQAAATSALEDIERVRASNEELRGAMTDDRRRLETTSRELNEARQKLSDAESRIHGLHSARDFVVEELQKVRSAEETLGQELASEQARVAAAAEESAELRRQLEVIHAEAARNASLHADAEQRLHGAAGGAALLEREVADLRSAMESDRLRAASELQQQRGRLDADWREKLEKIVAAMTSEHASQFRDAVAQRDQARGETRAVAELLRDLQGQVEKRDHAIAAEKAARQRVDAELREAVDQRDEARARALALKGEADEVLAAEKASRARSDAEWNEKLKKVVAGITSDHENDLGEAVVKREEARAETRALEARAREEKAAREKLDAEWNEKLQTIVAHLATDHEADLGQALVEKETARAEVRTLRQAQEKWNSIRESLVTKLERADAEIASLRAQLSRPAPPEPETPPIPEPPSEEQRARAEVVQVAEQAQIALKRATSPGTVPLPPAAPAGKRPLVLVVHHDPALRSMSRDNLHKNGFDTLTAADGLEGLRLAVAHKPDVVVADASMPKMNGRELCQLIKSNEETAGVKVILMTGVYTADERDDVPEGLGPDELLRKPVKFDALQSALTRLLQPA